MNLKRNSRWVTGLMAIALGLVSFGSVLRAQDQAPAGPDSGQGPGQPARAVRLSYVDGQVTLAQGGQVLAQPGNGRFVRPLKAAA